MAGKGGAVTSVQRFGGSLNLHVHFHVVAADNGGISPVEAAALLLETAWSVLLARPAPSYEG